jgi:hypothetical protein
MLKNEKGNVWYGLHFYPGVAEYREPGKDPYRVFLNESTIRRMDPTFAGRPVFVLHTEDELKGKSVDELKSMADGWVIESFFNQADGKHWAKFITVSDKADEKIKQGWTLSNAYYWKDTTRGGQWNGVDYQKEITDAEYDHLAIVPNPRYEESMVLTPEQFKTYNEEKLSELRRLQNNKKEPSKMKLKLFERKKVENQIDVENLVVLLPQTKREIAIVDAVEQLDALLLKNADKPVDQVTVKIDDEESLTIGELKEKYKALKNAYEELKNEDDCENEDDEDEDDEDDVMENEEDDEEARKKALELAEHEEKEILEKKKKAANKKKKNALSIEEQKKKEKDRLKAEKLRTANRKAQDDDMVEPEGGSLYVGGVEKGKARYGS